MKAKIELFDVSQRFRIYRNPSPALKEAVVNLLLNRKTPSDVFEFLALNNISLKIEQGERVGILGLNGAGKSTLLKTIVGIYPPTSGTIRTSGQIVPLIELGTGYDLEMTGRQNIYLNGALLGRTREEMKSLEKHIIEFSGLSEFMDMPIKYYSSGMLSRLFFSIGTMIEPEILIVDEVFATGDAQFVDKGMAKMVDLFNRSKIVIMVSHTPDDLRRACNRVLVMHQGQIVGDGDPEKMIDLYYREIVNQHLQECQPAQQIAS